MATLTKTHNGWSWQVGYDWQIANIVSSTNTVVWKTYAVGASGDATFDFSDIPIGATINSVNFTYALTGATAVRYITIDKDLLGTASRPTADNSNLKSVLDNGIRKFDIRFSCAGSNPNRSNALPNSAGKPVAVTSSSGYSNIALTVDYTYGSTGTLNKTTLNVGQTITLSIEAINETAQHKAEWYVGGTKIQSMSLAANVKQATFTPTASNLSSAVAQTGYCNLITVGVNDSNPLQVGSFTINVPDTDTYNPSINSIVSEPVYKFGLQSTVNPKPYYQNYTQAKITCTGITAGTGSTINSMVLTGTAVSQTMTEENGTYICEIPLTLSGSQTYVATATDGRGRTVTKSITINVEAVKPLTITSFNVVRGTKDSDSQMYHASSAGNTPLISYSIECPLMDKTNNSLSELKLTVTPAIGGVSTISEFNARQTSGNRVVNSAFAQKIGADTYTFTLTAKDMAGIPVTASYSLSQATCALHIANGGYGVGVGTFSEATSAATSEFRCAYPMTIKLNDEYYTIRIGDSGADGYITFVL